MLSLVLFSSVPHPILLVVLCAVVVFSVPTRKINLFRDSLCRDSLCRDSLCSLFAEYAVVGVLSASPLWGPAVVLGDAPKILQKILLNLETSFLPILWLPNQLRP